jgi:hypothetical protein
VSQLTIFLFGTGVFFLGGVGLVLIGLDAFRSWSDGDEVAGEGAFRAAEATRAVERQGRVGDRPSGEGA